MQDSLVQYGIYLAKFHFSDKPSVYKVRPVLILDAEQLKVATLKMTSVTDRSDVFIIDNYEKYNLDKPTAIILSEIFHLDRDKIFQDKFLGRLDEYDIEQIETLIGIAKNYLANKSTLRRGIEMLVKCQNC